MSRLDKFHIWDFHLAGFSKARCLCCNKTWMYRDAKKGQKGEWVKGHIIPASNLGPEIYENIRPICKTCNVEDKSFRDSYFYMVSIGTMSPETREKEIEKIKTLGAELAKDRTPINCLVCEHRRKPHSKFCGIHDKTDYHKKYAIYVRSFIKLLEQDLKLLNFLLQNDGPDEEIQIVTKCIEDSMKILHYG